MKPLVQGKVIVDIGTGTGILAIAAMLLSAKKVYTFEIDPDAITHAKKNFQLNGLQTKITVNEVPDRFDLLLINMISSEHEVAMGNIPGLQNPLMRSSLLVS